ncbi:RluA family pseudouridine synthase [Salinicoccus bachuensis]|uniref:Pseudouridine synthase n=1 Tax=Salinicoccus bachuensis TaxID=3136731 RepID=A0ABZ3CJS8_9STAP
MKNRKQSSGPDAEWKVQEPTELLKFLFEMMPSRSRKSVKGVLGRGQVYVNGEATTQFNALLHPGDRVEIQSHFGARNVKIKGIEILHEDDDVIVVEKEAGLLSIASEKENQMTAYRQLSDHVQRSHPKNRVFVVHRLDRDTSGVMMFAKSKNVQQKLQNAWKDAVSERSYIALVEGKVEQDGTITSWLTEDKTLTVRSSKNPNHGKKAVTHYKVLKSSRNLSLLKVHLETGRKNQIRVHMQELGHPIVGDKKYGSRSNPIRRMGLHAHVLAFKHPTSGKSLRFESEVPSAFMRNFN